MLFEFPENRHPELVQMYSKHQFLSIMIKSVLKDKAGEVYVDNLDNPKISVTTFKVIEFIGGISRHKKSKEILKKISENKLLLFPNDAWIRKAKKHLVLNDYQRTKFASRKASLRKASNKLSKKPLPEGYKIEPITAEILRNLNPRLAPAILPFYKSPEDFEKRGLGYCIKNIEKDLVVSLACSYLPIFDYEFDIQAITDPNPEYRRKGLATICCSTLIKDSLEQGYTPHWDADSEISTRFALKLGFVRPKDYTAYICARNPLKTAKSDE